MNIVILIGNVGNSEVRKTKGGDSVLTMSVATSQRWTDQESGDRRERTQWHNVVAFKRLAAGIGPHIAKGQKVSVRGMLVTREWEAPDGSKRRTTEVVADHIELLSPKTKRAVE